MTNDLAALLRDAEDELMGRILELAMRHGYTRYTSSKKEDWRLSVHGLTRALGEALRESGVREVGAEEDYQNDPAAAFGLEASRRHRERGVSLSMFQGLFKLYRRAYLAQLAECAPERADWRLTLETFFDRVELAFCSDWTACGEDAKLLELQESNRKLANSKNMFLTLVESLSQPIAVVGREREVFYANPAFNELQERIRADGGSLLHDPDWLRGVLEKTGENEVERLHECPLSIDGEQRFFDASFAPMNDVSGVFSGRVVLLDEVTEELRTRNAFEQSRRERIRMLDAMPVPVVITREEDGIIRYANEMAAQVVGVERSAMPGSKASDFYMAPEDRVRMLEQLQRQGMLRAYEVRLRRGGAALPCLMSAVRVRHFEEPCYLVTLLDISARKRIEDELAKLSQALQQSPIAIVITGRGGGIEYANGAFEVLTGYPLLEIKGREAGSILAGGDPEDDARTALERMWKSLEAGHSWRGEIHCRHRDGREYWVMVHTAFLLDSEGRVVNHVAFMEDITKRKLAEVVLQERLQFIQTLMDAVPTPIFYKNAEGVYQGCNRAFEEYFGILRPMLIGKTLLDLSRDEQAQSFHEKDVQLAGRGGVQIYESHVRRKDGEVRDVIHHKAAYRDARGNPAGIVGSVVDITERKRAERESRENEATLRQALSGIRAGILVVDPQTRNIEDVNERALELLQGERSEVVGHGCDVLVWRDVLGRAVDSDSMLREQSDREYRLERRGKGLLPVSVTVLPSVVRGKARVLMILFDLSERKALESQLNLAQKLESVGQLAAGIAHEINTPIQYVSSNLTFLAEAFGRIGAEIEASGEALSSRLRDDLTEVPEAIHDARDGVARVSSIVQAMRKFSHPDEEEHVPVDVNDAIRNTVTIARNEWKYHADVDLELDESLPSVVCVPGDFNQVVLNVLVNAAHAVAEKVGDSGEKGRIVIRTSTQGRFAQIEIEDTGKGIPEENRDKIFDPFFTTKVVGKGTGQGLAITHAIVERHHGEIDFQSEPGEGTTFFIRFPLEGLPREASQ